MSTMPENHHLTMDLEEKLKEDTNGEFKNNLQNTFNRQISEIDSELKKGAVPDEYVRLNTIKQGLQSAGIILERLWLYYHNR